MISPRMARAAYAMNRPRSGYRDGSRGESSRNASCSSVVALSETPTLRRSWRCASACSSAYSDRNSSSDVGEVFPSHGGEYGAGESMLSPTGPHITMGHGVYPAAQPEATTEWRPAKASAERSGRWPGRNVTDVSYNRFPWGRSSAGRASRSQCEGREFDPPRLHHEIEGRQCASALLFRFSRLHLGGRP